MADLGDEIDAIAEALNALDVVLEEEGVSEGIEEAATNVARTWTAFIVARLASDPALSMTTPEQGEAVTPRKCSLYDPTSNTMCDEWEGHDGGMHTPVGMERIALREAEERRFLARKHDGKNPYANKAAARRAAGMTTTTFGGARKMAYRCPVCEAWHVGASR